MAKNVSKENKDSGRSRFVKCLLPMVLAAIIVGGGFYTFHRVQTEKYKAQNEKLQDKLDIYKQKSDLLLDEVHELEDSIEILDLQLDSLHVEDSLIIEKIKHENERYRQKLNALDDFNNVEHFEFFTRYLDSVNIRRR